MTPESLRAWIVGSRRVEVRHEYVESPSAGAVMVAPLRVGICGTDLHTFAVGHPRAPFPICPGHEAVGKVVATGSGVHRLVSGDLVYLDPMVTCERCEYCQSGRPNLCRARRAFGAQLPGAMASLFIAPERQLRRVPRGLTPKQASLLEPLAAAVHAVRQVPRLRGASALILGAGTMGLGVLVAARAAESQYVTICDVRDAGLRLAKQLGAHECVRIASDRPHVEVAAALEEAPRVVVDCVGAISTLNAAQALVAAGGTVLLVGATEAGARFPAGRLQNEEITIRGSSMYTSGDFVDAERLMRATPRFEALITHEYALEDTALAFEAAMSGDDLKVQVLPASSRGSLVEDGRPRSSMVRPRPNP